MSASRLILIEIATEDAPRMGGIASGSARWPINPQIFGAANVDPLLWRDEALISEVRKAIGAGEIRRAIAVIDRLPAAPPDRCQEELLA